MTERVVTVLGVEFPSLNDPGCSEEEWNERLRERLALALELLECEPGERGYLLLVGEAGDGYLSAWESINGAPFTKCPDEFEVAVTTRCVRTVRSLVGSA